MICDQRLSGRPPRSYMRTLLLKSSPDTPNSRLAECGTAIKYDRRVAQRAIGHGKRHFADPIVYDFIVIEDSQWIRPRTFANRDTDDAIVGLQKRCIAGRRQFGFSQRWNAILGRSATDDSFRRNRGLTKIETLVRSLEYDWLR